MTCDGRAGDPRPSPAMARGGASRLAPGLRGKFLYGSYQRSATCCGSIQVASAVLWMIALGVSFSIALGGLPGVEKCMEKPLLPPPSPPPPRPPPEDVRHGGCPSECRGPAMLSARSGGLVSNGICDKQCNTAACRWDGGDCARGNPLDQLISQMFGGPDRYGRALNEGYDEYEREKEEVEDALEAAAGSTASSVNVAMKEEDSEEYYLDVLVHDVITPLLLGIGISGFLAAFASLFGGVLAICGAAARSPRLLRCSGILGAIGAVGGLLLCVGAAVFGGLLSAGNGDVRAIDIVLQREFPLRAEACAHEIDVYAKWVGRSLLALAGCCALGAIGAVGATNAVCEAASWTDAATVADSSSEHQSFFGNDDGGAGGGRGSMDGTEMLGAFCSPTGATSPPARGAKAYLAQKRRTSSSIASTTELESAAPPPPQPPPEVKAQLEELKAERDQLKAKLATPPASSGFMEELAAATAIPSVPTSQRP